jgi:hypothetical protein
MKLKDNLSYIFGYFLEFRIEFGGFFFKFQILTMKTLNFFLFEN